MISSRKASPIFALSAFSVALLGGCAAAVPGPAPVPPAATTGTGAPVTEIDPVGKYVQVVNGLCDETMTAVRQIVPTWYSAETPVAQYRLDAPKLRKVYDTFDQKFAAVPVPAEAQAAASAFRAYVDASDRTKAAALAAASSQATFAAEFARQDSYWDNNPVI